MKYLFTVLTIASVAFIFGNSLMEGESSGRLSAIALEIIRGGAEFAGISRELITEYMVRKLAHFCEYALFGFLLTATVKAWRETLKPFLFMVLFVGLAVPVADEFLQTFVPGRNGAVGDVLLDFAGVLGGVVVCSMLLKVLCRKR